MMLAKAMADIYEENRNVCKYVHSTSRGHEAIQLATAYQLKKEDWVSPYYRDESILLGIGFEPYQLMLQLLAKADDPFREEDHITHTLQVGMKTNQNCSSEFCYRNADHSYDRSSTGYQIHSGFQPSAI